MKSLRDQIRAQLADLKMPGSLEGLDAVLSRVDSGLGAAEAISSVLGAQIALRNNRRLEAAMRSSRLPAVKTLADFDFGFQPSLKREQIESLATLGFLLVCGLVFGVGALVSGGLSAANGSSLGAGAIGGGVLLLCLIGLVIMLAIYALQFFAIPRVMLDGVEPFAAMKESFSACLANIGAFLVFGVVFSVLCCVAAMVLIWIPIIGWIVMAGVGTVILGAALFVAWRQVYAGAAAATSAMPPPPAPQAPPPQP